MTAQLTKVSGNPDSHINPGYVVEGEMRDQPIIGKHLFLSGFVKDSNGQTWGYFKTTPVVGIALVPDGRLITTKNSVWLLKELT